MQRLAADGINLLSSAGDAAGQEVFHLHVHVVPRYADEPGLRLLINPDGRTRRRAGLGVPPDPGGRVTLPTRSATAASLPVGRRLTRAAVEFLPPMAVALLILPCIIQYGKLVPWQPSTIDLQVYVYAVKDMLAGRDIFTDHDAVLESLLHLSADRGDLDDPACLRPLRVLAGGLDSRAGLGPAIGAEALRRAAGLEARAARHRGACSRSSRSAPHLGTAR